MPAQQVQDLIRVLIGYEAEVQFGERLGGQHGLAAGALVPTGNAADRARWIEQIVPSRLAAVPRWVQEGLDPKQIDVLADIQRLTVAGSGVALYRRSLESAL